MKLFNFSVFLAYNVEAVTPTGCCDTYQVQDEYLYTCNYQESQVGKAYTDYDGFKCSYRYPGSSTDDYVYMKYLDGTAPNGRGVPKLELKIEY